MKKIFEKHIYRYFQYFKRIFEDLDLCAFLAFTSAFAMHCTGIIIIINIIFI